jgi:hypothetical protein
VWSITAIAKVMVEKCIQRRSDFVFFECDDFLNSRIFLLNIMSDGNPERLTIAYDLRINYIREKRKLFEKDTNQSQLSVPKYNGTRRSASMKRPPEIRSKPAHLRTGSAPIDSVALPLAPRPELSTKNVIHRANSFPVQWSSPTSIVNSPERESTPLETTEVISFDLLSMKNSSKLETVDDPKRQLIVCHFPCLTS